LGANFNRLWLGESVSIFGSALTQFAMPLLAAQTLQATPGEMGLLTAAEFAPMLLLGLFIGVWVDRGARLPVMIWSNFLRACGLALVPVLWWMGWLSLAALVAIAVVLAAVAAGLILPATSAGFWRADRDVESQSNVHAV
jgi:MFS family permease